MKLTQHFSLEEFLRSSVAQQHNIILNPSDVEINRIKKLCENLLEPLRELLDSPIIIVSGYRNIELNKLLKGSINSQHILGEAADIFCKNIHQIDLFTKIYNYALHGKLTVDQCILEFFPEPNKYCVHVSYTVRRPNRNQFFHIYKR